MGHLLSPVALRCAILSLGCGFLFPVILCCQNEAKEEKIRGALDKGTRFLSKIQRTDGGICDTLNPLFDTWETVLAATALYETNGGDTNQIVLHHALAYLRQQENAEGLICHNKRCKEAYCLETSAAYFLLLKETGQAGKVNVRAKKILDFQKTTGEWMVGNPDVREQKDFPSVSGFALSLLQTLNLKPLYPEEALHWLLEHQSPEGDWGAAWEYYDCPAYALSPVLQALDMHHTREADLAKQKAAQYIRSRQHSDGSWGVSSAVSGRGPSSVLQTGLMLSAMKYVDYAEKAVQVDKAIDFLLAQQQADGSWDGGYFPIDSPTYIKKEYVFATAQAMMVLQNYLTQQKNGK
ncbi:MAG: hypothetical protein LCH81_22720 [Bacteroidetes bacterium]|nr:hypothetical protein [Bacteroidota bacterium]